MRRPLFLCDNTFSTMYRVFFFFFFFFIEKPQTFRHVNVHMIYSVHTYVSRRQQGNGGGGEAWAARPTVGLGVNTGQTHRGGGGGG